MENDFKIHGYMYGTNSMSYVIELSDDGSMARVGTDYGHGIDVIVPWREIEYDNEEGDGEPYVADDEYNRKFYLKDFMRHGKGV